MTIAKYIKEKEEYLKKLNPENEEYNKIVNEIKQANIELIRLSLIPGIDLKSA